MKQYRIKCLNNGEYEAFHVQERAYFFFWRRALDHTGNWYQKFKTLNEAKKWIDDEFVRQLKADLKAENERQSKQIKSPTYIYYPDPIKVETLDHYTY